MKWEESTFSQEEILLQNRKLAAAKIVKLKKPKYHGGSWLEDYEIHFETKPVVASYETEDGKEEEIQIAALKLELLVDKAVSTKQYMKWYKRVIPDKSNREYAAAAKLHEKSIRDSKITFRMKGRLANPKDKHLLDTLLVHPHIGISGVACLGGYFTVMRAAIRNQEWPYLGFLVTDFLENVDPGDMHFADGPGDITIAYSYEGKEIPRTYEEEEDD